MSEIIQHLINYTVDELKQLYRTGETFRKYPKNPKFALDKIRQSLESISNDIEVSNLGNIKINGIQVSQFEKDDRDIYVTLQNGIDYKVYRLVAETWCHFPFEDTYGWQVHHINDDYNNRADNLIWCEGQMHLNKIHK
jgi:hypothetical protein